MRTVSSVFPATFCVVILSLVFTLPPRMGRAQETPDLDELFTRAGELLQAKKYDEAIEAFKKVIEIDETAVAAYYNIACAFSLQKKTGDALDWFEKSLERGFLDYGHIKQDTDLDNIRTEPRFKELIVKYNLEIEEKTETYILKGFDSSVTGAKTGELASYCYMVACAATKEAAIIDPSGGVDEIAGYLEKNGLALKHILITHCHYDHVSAIKAWVARTKAKIYVHADMVAAMQELGEDMTVVGVADNGKIEVGKLSFKTFHSPGHSDDSVCFYLENEGRLFSGDALNFVPGRISDGIRQYFQKYFSAIKEEAKVYLGHVGCRPFSAIKKMVEEER
ncbi:MAG: MBL fold metallo-hydrolase [Planctomycetota bacterium]|nr:MBL fold metallo-hydrolase [Planctomycetota bacterium]